MNNKPPVLIIDFDDLLVNSCLLHKRAFEDVLKEEGIQSPIPEDLYASIFGMRIRDICGVFIERLALKISIDDYVRRRDLVFMGLVRKDLELMPGALEMAEFIKGRRGLRRALASSGTREYIVAGLKKVGFDGFFDVITTGDEVKKGKPDPEIFTLTAKKMGVKPRECVVIEDAENGIAAAKAAGMKCVGVMNPFTKIKQDLSKADIVVKSLAAITEELLNKLYNPSS